jgi:hypothetical protein
MNQSYIDTETYILFGEIMLLAVGTLFLRRQGGRRNK